MRLFIWGSALLVCSLAAVTSTEAADKPVVFRAGAAAIDVSPKVFPLNMPGGFAANMAESNHDPLHSRAVVLDDGTTTIALVLVDNLGLAAEAIEDAKAIASKQCGIATDKMLVSATHTHSAPASNVKEGPEPAVAYRKVLVTGIAESIVKAHAALRPAAVGYAAHPLPDEVFNRRWFLKPGKMPPNPFGRLDQVKMNPGTSPDVLDRPAGPTDPDITVLSIQDAKKKPLAIYANYSLHYVGGTPKAQVSADYFGEFARVMPSRLRGDDEFVAIMTNGTSGDINNIPFGSVRPPRQEFEQIRLVAAKAADTAWFAHQKIGPHRNDARIGMRQRLITLKMRKPTAEQLATARTIAAITDKEELAKHPPLADSYARRAIALAEGPDSVTVPLQAIRIGDFAICAIPFETFCEIGLELKARSPFGRSMIVSIANGYNGYLPTPEQHKLGGYETWLGTNKVQEDTSVILVENLVEMLAELKKAD